MPPKLNNPRLGVEGVQRRNALANEPSHDVRCNRDLAILTDDEHQPAPDFNLGRLLGEIALIHANPPRSKTTERGNDAYRHRLIQPLTALIRPTAEICPALVLA